MSRALFGESFMRVETPKYDFWINDLRRVKKLTTDDKTMQYRWLVDHITEVGENVIWVNKAAFIKTC